MALIKFNSNGKIKIQGKIKAILSILEEKNAIKFNSQILKYNGQDLTFNLENTNILKFNNQGLQYNEENLTFNLENTNILKFNNQGLQYNEENLTFV